MPNTNEWKNMAEDEIAKARMKAEQMHQMETIIGAGKAGIGTAEGAIRGYSGSNLTGAQRAGILGATGARMALSTGAEREDIFRHASSDIMGMGQMTGSRRRQMGQLAGMMGHGLGMGSQLDVMRAGKITPKGGPPSPGPLPGPLPGPSMDSSSGGEQDEITMQQGGIIPGQGSGDKVPIMGEPGEIVIPKDVVDFKGKEFFLNLIDKTKANMGKVNNAAGDPQAQGGGKGLHGVQPHPIQALQGGGEVQKYKKWDETGPEWETPYESNVGKLAGQHPIANVIGLGLPAAEQAVYGGLGNVAHNVKEGAKWAGHAMGMTDPRTPEQRLTPGATDVMRGFTNPYQGVATSQPGRMPGQPGIPAATAAAPPIAPLSSHGGLVPGTDYFPQGEGWRAKGKGDPNAAAYPSSQYYNPAKHTYGHLSSDGKPQYSDWSGTGLDEEYMKRHGLSGGAGQKAPAGRKQGKRGAASAFNVPPEPGVEMGPPNYNIPGLKNAQDVYATIEGGPQGIAGLREGVDPSTHPSPYLWKSPASEKTVPFGMGKGGTNYWQGTEYGLPEGMTKEQLKKEGWSPWGQGQYRKLNQERSQPTTPLNPEQADALHKAWSMGKSKEEDGAIPVTSYAGGSQTIEMVRPRADGKMPGHKGIPAGLTPDKFEQQAAMMETLSSLHPKDRAHFQMEMEKLPYYEQQKMMEQLYKEAQIKHLGAQTSTEGSKQGALGALTNKRKAEGGKGSPRVKYLEDMIKDGQARLKATSRLDKNRPALEAELKSYRDEYNKTTGGKVPEAKAADPAGAKITALKREGKSDKQIAALIREAGGDPTRYGLK